MSSRSFRTVMLSLGLLAAAGLALSGCGRKGELDPPSTPTEKLNRRGNDTRPAVQDRPFILDPLL
ncbi:lipoprotein [Rhizobiaceae bacterium BDR2-2]|uniref:Lipoprotein n=1 Tax=Ectorhizobium quercum TaxID=2965071 RepID=A0AAE3N4N8_9HYPH|nr:lipoprotein [Ectorhizobium quercum]MCX8999180.1 lipoprotein [Ectorhizobium quercum]